MPPANRKPPALDPDAVIRAVDEQHTKLVQAWDPIDSDWNYIPGELIPRRVKELLRELSHPRVDD
jgi:hypothetical protein